MQWVIIPVLQMGEDDAERPSAAALKHWSGTSGSGQMVEFPAGEVPVLMPDNWLTLG